MKISRFVVPAVLGLMALSSARASRADSIGINFTGNYAANVIDATTSAGVVVQTNWNNLGGSSGTSGALNNNLGAATTTTLSYSASNVNQFQPNTAAGDEQLNNGYIKLDGTNPITLNLNNISYNTYDIYVYNLAGTNLAGTGTQLKTTLGSISYYSTSPNARSAGYIDENAATPYTYTQATSTSQASSTAGANYVRFTGLSGTSQSINVSSLNYSNFSLSSAVGGIQVVNTTIATPEPSTYAMMALGLVALCVLGAKRKKDGQAI
jgi:hypothetical protein